MYTDSVPEYRIDLGLSEADRWVHVIRKEKRAALSVAREALEELGPAQQLARLVGVPFAGLYRLYGGRYQGEIAAWADALGVSAGTATLLNCTYELSHARDALGLLPRLFGCTAGARWVKGLGMVHVRSMDWPLRSVGRATRLFRFVGGHHPFVSVGITGFVGVLSGMVPGGYSVTINWAPAPSRPTFDFGPAFLLREVLEECATYDEAVYSLRRTKLASPVFFLVCGTKKGQACVIERSKTSSAVREMDGDVLVQANHHVARKFRKNNDLIDDEDNSESLLAESMERAETLTRALSGLGRSESLAEVARALDVPPVCNADSYQQMAFRPGRDHVAVWRWL